MWIISVNRQTTEVSTIIIFHFTDEESEFEPGLRSRMSGTSLPSPRDKTFPHARLTQPMAFLLDER